MIVGIGTDIVTISRVNAIWQRFGERMLDKFLADNEHEACRYSTEPARFLAKRFAAKEALGKALGCGIRKPLLLPAIEITHDALGKPGFNLDAAADALLGGQRRVAHLSLADEQSHVIAFVVVEQR